MAPTGAIAVVKVGAKTKVAYDLSPDCNRRGPDNEGKRSRVHTGKGNALKGSHREDWPKRPQDKKAKKGNCEN